ncbi:MAG TPA: hypothetical protein VFA40_02830 [Terriglobales bacterium]|nr:hypothetical protein [Terriglobales bacterium]
MKEQIVYINLMETDPLADDLRCNSLILHFHKNSRIEVGELALALKEQLISCAFAGICPPVPYLILQTAIGILENRREFSTVIVPGNRLSPEVNNGPVALLRISSRR